MVRGGRALCRFELLEVLVRLADVKYRRPKLASSMSEAVRMLCERCIKPVLEPLQHWLDSNVFRKEQLYWWVDHAWSCPLCERGCSPLPHHPNAGARVACGCARRAVML